MKTFKPSNQVLGLLPLFIYFSLFICKVLIGLSSSLFALVHIFHMSSLSSRLSPVFYAVSAYIVPHSCQQKPILDLVACQVFHLTALRFMTFNV